VITTVALTPVMITYAIYGEVEFTVVFCASVILWSRKVGFTPDKMSTFDALKSPRLRQNVRLDHMYNRNRS
jgi:hypothetical protein